MVEATDEAALLAAIIAQPEEDTPRLVYADWLQERDGETACPCEASGYAHGDTCYGRCSGTGRIRNCFSQRAEFIRVQVEVAQLEKPGSGADPKLGIAWNAEQQRHVAPTPSEFTRLMSLRERAKRFLEYHAHEWFAVHPVHIPEAAYFAQWWNDVRRGFRERITCSAADWLSNGNHIRTQHPVTRVRLTTEMAGEHVVDGFRLHGDGPHGRVTCRFRYTDGLVSTVKHCLDLCWPGVTFELPG